MRAKATTPVRNIGPDQQRLARELARVQEHRDELWTQLQEHAETMTERAARGEPVKRLLQQHERMRDRYIVVENRRQELLAVVPRPVELADF